MVVKKFFKGALPLITGAATLFAMQLVFSLFSLSATALMDARPTLSFILFVLFYASTFVFVYFLGSSAAYTDFNVRKNNALRIKNGEAVEDYKLLREYRPWKGFAMGALSLLPLVLSVLLSLLIGSEGFYAVVRLCFVLYYMPFHAATGSMSVLPMLLACIPVSAICGAGYLIRGYKLQAQQEKLAPKANKSR